MSSTPPRSAYIHVPFCKHRCGYCNFTLITGRDDLINRFLKAIEIELKNLKEPHSVDTLYFGGGTPTYLPPQQLSQLCKCVLQWHPLAHDYEWTVEANPGDLDEKRMEILAQFGVNRISLGAQSFRDKKLSILERDHSAADIDRSVELAKQYKMQVSLDLIFAAPEESLEQWQNDLEMALKLKPEHISTYGLTYERGTSFWSRLDRQELHQAPEELERTMYLEAIQRLNEAGFEHYEISNFARPGYPSRHNETYWAGESYFAAGPGAARYVDGVRSTNHRSTTTYLNRVLAGDSPIAEQEELDAEQRAREMLVFGLRRIAGVKRKMFSDRTGLSMDDLAGPEIAKFVELGMLADDGEKVQLTRDGLLVSDSLWPELL